MFLEKLGKRLEAVCQNIIGHEIFSVFDYCYPQLTRAHTVRTGLFQRPATLLFAPRTSSTRRSTPIDDDAEPAGIRPLEACVSLSIEGNPKYNFLSFWPSFPLSSKRPERRASFPIIRRRAATAASWFSPSTLFMLMEITGNFPIYFSHRSFSCMIFNPSNSAGSLPISKKHFSILILRDLPNRLGRVNRFTSP